MPDNDAMADVNVVMPGSRPRSRTRSLRGRMLALVLGALIGVLQRLPDRVLHRLAHQAGGLLFHLRPTRRRLVRRNLERVCRYLVEHDQASPRVSAAAIDALALDRLVREAFGHYVRSYLEGAIAPIYAAPERVGRITAEDPETLRQALGGVEAGPEPAIIVGLHFGAMEIPALWAIGQLGIKLTAPMETVTNPELQAYFERTRSVGGLNIIATQGAGRELVAALARGEAVALVADRVVAGAGAPVELFGAPTRLPVGPAALAVETGVSAWLVAARRTGWGDYRAHIERIPLAESGSRRERIRAFLDAQARAYERAIALAPEQWWAVFFPIWEDGA